MLHLPSCYCETYRSNEVDHNYFTEAQVLFIKIEICIIYWLKQEKIYVAVQS